MQNQVVGDAITNFLCLESAMAYLNMTAKDWLKIYTDMECQNKKVAIRDKSKIKVVWTEDKILEPISLQEGMDKIIQGYPGSRAFARPSGTEDVVRVYVEANSEEMVKEIMEKIIKSITENKEVN